MKRKKWPQRYKKPGPDSDKTALLFSNIIGDTLENSTKSQNSKVFVEQKCNKSHNENIHAQSLP